MPAKTNRPADTDGRRLPAKGLRILIRFFADRVVLLVVSYSVSPVYLVCAVVVRRNRFCAIDKEVITQGRELLVDFFPGIVRG
jgi:hypothetical protein